MYKNRDFCNGVSEFSGFGVGVAVGLSAACPYGLPPPHWKRGILLWGTGVDLGSWVGSWSTSSPLVGEEGRFREVGGYGVMGRDLGSWGGKI